MANNLGDQILKTVDEILDSGNLEKLNSAISDTVFMALDEARRQLEKAAEDTKKSVTVSKTETKEGVTVSKTKTKKSVTVSGNEIKQRSYAAPKAKIKKVGKVSGILLKFFGGIGTGVWGLSILAELVSDLVNPVGYIDTAGLSAAIIMCAISVWMLCAGIRKRSRLKRAERYLQLMQGKAYNNISELSLLAHKNEQYVCKDLKKMIEVGIFPEGHLSSREDCFIMGDVAYREFIRMEKSQKAVQAEIEEQKRLEAQSAAAEEKVDAENAELDAIIREGNGYIKQLRDLNDLIEGEVISAKLFHLENILKEIFEQLKEHPEQMPEMHKFMEYYLPTTLKLVTAYEEFDRVSVPGEDILASKREIEKTLDTINMAFEELLNKLFRSRVFDVTTDAQVLKTMLAREGLTKEPVFVGRKEVENE